MYLIMSNKVDTVNVVISVVDKVSFFSWMYLIHEIYLLTPHKLDAHA